MGLLSGISGGLFSLILIFGMGYYVGHKSYQCVVTPVDTVRQNMQCHLTLGTVVELPNGVVVCTKIKGK